MSNSWTDDFDEIEPAMKDLADELGVTVADLRREGGEPRQCPATGIWTFMPEPGLSGYSVPSLTRLPAAILAVENYGIPGLPYCLFESDDFDLGKGSDREDLFRDAVYAGQIWWQREARSSEGEGVSHHCVARGFEKMAISPLGLADAITFRDFKVFMDDTASTRIAALVAAETASAALHAKADYRVNSPTPAS